MAAELAGCGQMRIIFTHLVPSFLSHIIAATTLAIPAMIISETSLSFLGLGLRPPAVRIAVKILRGPMTEIATVMDVPPRRPALIGGPPHGPGVLIIAIRSRP